MEFMMKLIDHIWDGLNVTGGECLHPKPSTIANLKLPTAILVQTKSISLFDDAAHSAPRSLCPMVSFSCALLYLLVASCVALPGSFLGKDKCYFTIDSLQKFQCMKKLTIF